MLPLPPCSACLVEKGQQLGRGLHFLPQTAEMLFWPSSIPKSIPVSYLGPISHPSLPFSTYILEKTTRAGPALPKEQQPGSACTLPWILHPLIHPPVSSVLPLHHLAWPKLAMVTQKCSKSPCATQGKVVAMMKSCRRSPERSPVWEIPPLNLWFLFTSS